MGETGKAIGGLVITAIAIYGAVKYIIGRWKEEKPEFLEKISGNSKKASRSSGKKEDPPETSPEDPEK